MTSIRFTPRSPYIQADSFQILPCIMITWRAHQTTEVYLPHLALNQNFWAWGLDSCICTTSPRNSDAHLFGSYCSRSRNHLLVCIFISSYAHMYCQNFLRVKNLVCTVKQIELCQQCINCCCLYFKKSALQKIHQLWDII